MVRSLASRVRSVLLSPPFLIFLFAGIGGILPDIDHVPEAFMENPPFMGRAFHTHILIASIAVAGVCTACLGRLVRG